MTTVIDSLQKVFATRSRALEMLYLLDDAKPALRFDASEAELRHIFSFCKDNGLFLEVSDFKVRKVSD